MKYRFRGFILFVLLVSSMLNLWAVPARCEVMIVKQPDGTQLMLTMRGDEHFHCLMTVDGVPVVRSKGAYFYAFVNEEGIEPSELLAHESDLRTREEQGFVEELLDVHAACAAQARERGAKRRAATEQTSEVPTKGEVHVPVLLVQYSDVKFSSSDPKAVFEERTNGENYTAEGGAGSIREYFIDQSDGMFVPQFEIIGPVTLGHEMKYYGGNDKTGSDLRPREMVSEACRKAYSELKVDMSRYDNNNDGYVDIMYVIYAGYGEASYPDKLEDTIWPHQWELESPLTLGGVKINRYACNNELDGYSGEHLDGIGTFCHEFSHCLGLPDFYDTSGGDSFGMSVWSVMDYGCYNNDGHTPCGYTAYEKDCLGWNSLVELTNPGEVVLKPLCEGGEAYKIVNEANRNEFFVVEYCQKTGWNTYAPAEGMLISHVDYLSSAWQNNVVNNTPNHQRMTIIPADGKLTSQTLAADVWPGKSGNTQLTSLSNPASKVYTGGYMDKDITNISMGEGMVTFSFMKGALPAPRLHILDSISPSGFTVAWDLVDSVDEYEVHLALLEENPYLVDEDFDKVKKGSADIGSVLDTYTRQTGWMGAGIYGLDGAIRIGNTSAGGVLMTPQLVCDSAAFTVIFTLRQSFPKEGDSYMVMAVGDQEWESLYGYGLTVDDKEWGTYFLVMDSIGNSPFLYIDTRDNSETPEKESLGIDFDGLYILPGDRTKELLGEDDSADGSRRCHAVHPKKIQVCSEWQPVSQCSMVRQKNEEVSSSEHSAQDGKRYDEVPIYVSRVKGNSFSFDELDGGFYRCRVRSVKNEVMSHYSNAVEVQVTDTLLPKTDTVPYMYIHRDSMYMQIPDSVAVYYTTDGTRPSAYSTKYTAPFVLKGKTTVRVVARRAGHRSSEIIDKSNWFVLDGATYRVMSTIEPAVLLSETMGGNGESDYAGIYVFGDEVETDTMTYMLKGIESHTFRNATALRSVTFESNVPYSIGDSLFHGCTSLNAVVWELDAPIKDNLFDEESYYNLLVYLPDTAQLSSPLIETQRMAIVKDGKSGTLQLSNDRPFYCPSPFVAEQVSYQRTFAQVTGLGESAGWETIVLPFDVQYVQHAKMGEIVPFGTEGSNFFWLAELGDKGFVPATEMRANIPYIVSMPNNAAYGKYRLNGLVTFSAEDAMIHATTENMVGVGPDFTLVSTYEKVEPVDTVYALNLNAAYEENMPGSVFVSGMYGVRPFSAYVLPAQNQNASMYRIALNEKEEEKENLALPFVVGVRGGVVYIVASEDRFVTVLDVAGRLVRTISCKAGVTEVALDAGMYIIEKTKIYVER